MIAERKKKNSQELADVKDLMRKMREQNVKFEQSTYCFSFGVAIKKKPKELYPFLERRSKQLT